MDNIICLSNALRSLVALFDNQTIPHSGDTYSDAEKSTMYVTLDAIKAQTVLLTNALDNL